MKRPPPTLEAEAAGADEALWRRLIGQGRAAYRVEARGASRRRARLQTVKILDAAGAFLCEAALQDRSDTGLRVTLARDCGLPARLGVYVDLTGELLTAAPAWRRARLVGLHVLAHGPPVALRRTERVALGGRYYAVLD